MHWRHEIGRAEDPDPSSSVTKLDEPPGENSRRPGSVPTVVASLVARLPGFELAKLSRHGGLYEMTPDHNPLLASTRGGRLLLANGLQRATVIWAGHGARWRLLVDRRSTTLT